MSKFLLQENRDKLQRMSNMIRYNNEVHIHNENVAEHSFYVAVYAMEICDILEIYGELRGYIIEKALIHDIHEIELSDIPHNVKKNIDGFEEKCIEFENKFNRNCFGRLLHNIKSSYNSRLVDLIVELADIISVKQYATQEVEFGNKKKFIPILDNTYDRIDKVLHEIEIVVDIDNFNTLKSML